MIEIVEIVNAVRRALVERLTQTGYTGESLHNPDDLKSTHQVDILAADAAHRVTHGKHCNVFVEAVPERYDQGAEYSIYIDPLDGSLNWERGTGDPCIVVAVSRKPLVATLDDLEDAYVLGLRSGDRYFTRDGGAYYVNALTGRESRITPTQTHPPLNRSVAYLRPGYGMAFNQLRRTLPLFIGARDVRAVDNAGIEFCEIARGAAQLMVEARGDGKRGSDFFNLLAWPILRAAGGVLCDLSGDDLTKRQIDVNGVYDYIAATDRALANEAAAQIAGFINNASYAGWSYSGAGK